MPLARIVTSNPEEVAYLCEYLRSRGYSIELVDPESLQSAAADLRLDCEGCSSEEALALGRDATEGAGNGRRVLAYDITGRPVEFADDEEAVGGKSRAFAEAWQRLQSARLKVVERTRLSYGHLRERIADGRRSLDRYRTHYQQVRTQAAAQAEESRRERQAQRQAFEAERSRRKLEQARRQAQIALERERLQAETRQHQQETRLVQETLPDPEPLRLPRRYRRDSDFQKAAVAAAVLALIAILGLGAYRNSLLRPHVSKRDLLRSEDVSQPVPFAVATAPVGMSTTQPEVKVASVHRVSPRPSEATAKSNAVNRVARVRPARTDESEFMGEDRVIVHRLPSGTSQARANTHPGLKRISDLD
jgi:hypothetical protein